MRFWKRRTQEASVVEQVEARECPHVTLVPRWGSAADIGIEDRASAYLCDSCKRTFEPQEARALRSSEAERLRQELASE